MVDVATIPAGPRIRAWADSNHVDPWLAARLWQIADEPRFLEGLLRRPPRYLRANPLREDPDTTRRRLAARDFELASTDLDPLVWRVRRAPHSTGATPEHLMGRTTPQDLASASAPLALGAQPGDVVADMAAAPGVKTVHVAGDMADAGALVCAEPSPDRARALRFNLERCGVTSATVHDAPAQDLPGEAWADRVLLDAPCTGEGTMPRDRARRRGSRQDVARMAGLQSTLMDAADRILRPGGVLVYATCTFAPEENEAQVQRMVERGYRIEDLPFDRCGGEPLRPGRTEWPGLELDPGMGRTRRFLPGVHGTLGFFVARLRKEDA